MLGSEPGAVPPPPRPPLTTAKGLARNVLFSVATQAWIIVLALVTIRIVIHGLGADAYGIFVIASLLLGYAAFLDLGLTAAVVRSIAQYRTAGATVGLERIIGTAFGTLLILGLVGGLALALLTPFAVGTLLHIPTALQADARFVFYLAALAFVLNMGLVIFAAIPQGLQRLDLLSIRNALLTTSTAIGQIAVIEFRGGLRWLAVVSFASNVASLAVFGILAPRLLPGMSFRPRISLDALRELASFGAKRFVSQAAVQAIFQLDRIIVGVFLPIRAVTFYSVPLSITQRFLVFHGSITNTYFPAASELHGLRDTARMRRLYLTTLKLNAVLMFVLVALVGALAVPILDAWLGSEFARGSAAILVVLALGYGLAALAGLSGQLTDASGHPGWTAWYAVGSAALNIILSVTLVPRVGAIGAAYAILIANGIGGLFFLTVTQWRLLRLSVGETLAQVVRPAAAGVLVAVAGVLAAPHLHGVAPVIAALLAGGAIYVVLTFALGVWDTRERRLAKETIIAVLPFTRSLLGEGQRKEGR
jgi:O-antigen/teichoic acid export membrane protein